MILARHRQVLASAVFVLDGALLALAWVGSWWLRFRVFVLAAPLGEPPLSLYLWSGAVLTPLALLVLRSFQISRPARTARLSQELFALFQGMAIITAIAAVGAFFSKGALSRVSLVIFSALATTLLSTSRIAIRSWLRFMRRRGRNLRGTLIVGTGELAAMVLEKIREHPDFGLEVLGLVAAGPAPAGAAIGGVPVLGSVHDLPGLAERTGAELVYLALARSEYEAEREALERLADSTAAVRLVPDLARAFTLNASVEDFDGMPVVLVTESPGQGWNAVLKRGFDLVFAALGLVILSPLLLLLALWVRLDSPGPVLYAQERVGLSGRHFR